MAGLFDRVGMSISSGGTGDLTLGSRLGAVAPNLASFCSLADASVANGTIVSYLVINGLNSDVEWGTATYSTSGPKLTSRTVTGSIIAGTAGTSAITVDTSAQVFIALRAEDTLDTAETSVASATTTDIGNTATSRIAITGTTTITSLGSQANKVRIVRFAGALTLTYNSTSLILPGAKSITTAAGDTAIFQSDSSGNWRCVNYQSSTQADQAGLRSVVYAAPFDALAYNGMQVNGSTEVSQANGTSSVSLSNNTAAYCVDGIKATFSSSSLVMAAQQVTPSGSPSFGQAFQQAVQLKATTGAALGASDYALLSIPIEGYRTSRVGFGNSNAQPVTVGVWVYATISGTVTAALQNNAGTRSQPVNATLSNATTWQFLTFTFTGDTTGTWLSTNGAGFNLLLCFGSGSTFQGTNATWSASNVFATSSTTNFFASNSNLVQVTGLVVLPGIELPSAARSPFIMRPLSIELPMCQRYYELSYDYGTAPGAITTTGAFWAVQGGGTGTTANWTSSVFFKTTKRADPTMTAYSPNSGASGKIYDGQAEADITAIVSPVGESSFRIGGLSIDWPANIEAHWVADARL